MKTEPCIHFVAALVICVALGADPLVGQTASDARAQALDQPTTTQPVDGLAAKVIDVAGDVHAAPVGTGVLDSDAWKPIKKGDELGSGTQIRTGLRSHVVLLFGDDTVISVRRATLASIDQFYRTETGKTVHLGLGYGAVRGGTTEGTLRSDVVVVDSPVATLAKRGTEGWEMEVEAYTGRFRISLAQLGLIEALQKHTGQRRLVRAGEYANQLNIASMWVNQAIFDRVVHFVSANALSHADVDFNSHVTGGVAPVLPGGGSDLPAFAGRGQAGGLRPPLDGRLPQGLDRLLRDVDTVVTQPSLFFRAEGNYGVRTPSRVLIDSQDARKLRRRR